MEYIEMEIGVGDMVRLKKRHPCGGDRWRVVRVGADVGLRCERCQRRLLLTRGVFERRLSAVLAEGEGTAHQDTEGVLYDQGQNTVAG